MLRTHSSFLRRFLSTMACSMLAAFAHAQYYDLVVAQDGTGDYLTIQDAILAIRDYKPEGRQRILVRKGIYEEKVVVPTYKTNISLIGEDCDSCILVWHDHANLQQTGHFEGVVLGSKADEMGRNKRDVGSMSDRGHRLGTFESYTLLALGDGFECENMTISNDAMTYYNPDWYQTRSNKAGVGQAVSVHCEADRSVFRNCRIHGFQDTVFNGNARSRQIFYGCYIDGTVDFIFGPATVWFEDCHIHSISKGYLTAASTPAENPYGYVFRHCRVTADEQAGGVYLGRPWRNYASVIFMECELPEVIHAEGWHNWSDPKRELTARYAEYHNTGAGARPSQRVAWSRQLSDAEAAAVTLERVMHQSSSDWASNVRSVTFDEATRAYIDKGVKYVASTLEPAELPADADRHVEPLVIKLDAVDCTTFVEYVTAAILGRVAEPTPSDSIFQRFVQALRYRDGRRGNYASRKHYFSEWISDAQAYGMLTEVTPSIPVAKPLHRSIDFMSKHLQYYPLLSASPAMLAQVQEVESLLSSQSLSYVPSSRIREAYASLRHGDIVAFVTDTRGLDVQHVGFVWWPDTTKGEPHLLHASSSLGRVCVSDATLADYALKARHCMGIRIVRLNQMSPLSRIE